MSDLLKTLLLPVTPEAPCGPNLEYDPAFTALERAMRGKPEQQIGSTIVPAAEPDWLEVKRLALEVLARSKDLRAASGLAQALLRLNGLSGFAEGMSVLRGLVETFWDTLHPQPDPDDEPDDPTMRVNILMGLTEPIVLGGVRAAPLVSSRAVGRFTLKDVETASGDLPPPAGTEAPALATIEAAVADADLGELEATSAAMKTAREALAAIESFIAERAGAERAPTLGKVSTLLRKASAFLEAGLVRRQPLPEATPGEAGSGSDAGLGNAPGTPGSRRRGPAGEIESREDVLRALEEIIRYYAKHEPSSPIPLFMERCQRLVSMNFVDIVRDLVPDALSQVDILRGGAK